MYILLSHITQLFFLHFSENFISALRFCDVVAESCTRKSSHGGVEKKKEMSSNKNTKNGNNIEIKFNTKNEDSLTEKIKFEKNAILNALLNSFFEIFLKNHVRSSLLSTGEQQSLASFTLSRILLSELRKSTGNGILLNITASYMCGGTYKENEILMHNKNTTNKNINNNNDNIYDDNSEGNMSRPVYDMIASIISRAKSKNRDLAVSSTLLLSSVIRSSDLTSAATLCDKREGDGFPFNSTLNSLQNTPITTVSVDNTPIIIDRENPLGVYRKIGSHVITDVRDFHRNLLIESINQDNDSSKTESGKENTFENSIKNKNNKDNDNNEINKNSTNDSSDITKWEKVEFENLESRLTRICEEIFYSDKKFNFSFNLDPILDMNSKENREIDDEKAKEREKNRKLREKEVTEYDILFSSKYTDVSASNITARLSGRLSSWLHFNGDDYSSKSDDIFDDKVQPDNIVNGENKVRIEMNITTSKNDTNKDQNENNNNSNKTENSQENGSESESDSGVKISIKKEFERNFTHNVTRSVLFDFILYRLTVFPDLRYEEQVALSGIIRDTLCVLCSTLVDRSLNYESQYENKNIITMKMKTNVEEKIEINVNTINQIKKADENKAVHINDFDVQSRLHYNDDILIFILNIVEITSSLRKDMKSHLKSVALHGLKIKVLHDILCASSSFSSSSSSSFAATTLPLSEVKHSVTNDKKNSISQFNDSSTKNKENNISQISVPKDNGKSSVTPLNVTFNEDVVILNDENCRLVAEETKQNKRILETTVILNELLRETQGMVFATNKLKLSLLTALNYSKSVIVFDENMRMDKNIFENTEFEFDDDIEMDEIRVFKETVKDGNSEEKENISDDDFDMIKDESLNGKKSDEIKTNPNKFSNLSEKNNRNPTEIPSNSNDKHEFDNSKKCETDFLFDYDMLEKELLNIYS